LPVLAIESSRKTDYTVIAVKTDRRPSTNVIEKTRHVRQTEVAVHTDLLKADPNPTTDLQSTHAE
jgi:predicted transcriptional regulator